MSVSAKKACAKKVLGVAGEVAAIAILPAVLIACAVTHVGGSAALILCAAIASLLAFFSTWESSVPGLRQVVFVAVMAAMAAAGRIIFAALPGVQPVTAICIIAGMMLGRRAGFMTGACAAFVSNCFLGQGIWTPWQMYAWGLVGYLSGLLPLKQNPCVDIDLQRSCRATRSYFLQMAGICVFGILASYLYSFIMNSWIVVGYYLDAGWAAILAVYVSGVFFDTAHAASTAIFLVLLYVPWSRKLARIKTRFALA